MIDVCVWVLVWSSQLAALGTMPGKWESVSPGYGPVVSERAIVQLNIEVFAPNSLQPIFSTVKRGMPYFVQSDGSSKSEVSRAVIGKRVGTVIQISGSVSNHPWLQQAVGPISGTFVRVKVTIEGLNHFASGTNL